MVGGVGIKRRRMKVKNGFISKLHRVGEGEGGREGSETKEGEKEERRKNVRRKKEEELERGKREGETEISLGEKKDKD